MSESTEIVKAIVKQFRDELKTQEPYAYADHENLLIDLGWDISQGDGEICTHVENMLSFKIDDLPEHIKQVIWWESWGGQVMKKNILEEINNSDGDLTNIPVLEPNEVLNDIVEFLKETVFTIAETAYDQYQEMESEDEYEDDDSEKEFDNNKDDNE
jgi:hypothetical protein